MRLRLGLGWSVGWTRTRCAHAAALAISVRPKMGDAVPACTSACPRLIGFRDTDRSMVRKQRPRWALANTATHSLHRDDQQLAGGGLHPSNRLDLVAYVPPAVAVADATDDNRHHGYPPSSSPVRSNSGSSSSPGAPSGSRSHWRRRRRPQLRLPGPSHISHGGGGRHPPRSCAPHSRGSSRSSRSITVPTPINSSSILARAPTRRRQQQRQRRQPPATRRRVIIDRIPGATAAAAPCACLHERGGGGGVREWADVVAAPRRELSAGGGPALASRVGGPGRPRAGALWDGMDGWMGGCVMWLVIE